jgi:hypothetical protein
MQNKTKGKKNPGLNWMSKECKRIGVMACGQNRQLMCSSAARLTIFKRGHRVKRRHKIATKLTADAAFEVLSGF